MPSALNRGETPCQRSLMSLLEMSLGGAPQARAAVAEALAASGRGQVPEAPGDLLDFVRAHLMTILAGAMGPRLTMALLDDLATQLGVGPFEAESPPPSGPPSSMPRPLARLDLRPASSRRQARTIRVLLVDASLIGRPALARALLRASCEVTVADVAGDVVTAVGESEIEIALIDGEHPQARAIVAAILAARPGIPVIVRSADAVRARALLGAHTEVRLDVRSRDASPDELVEAVRQGVAP